MSTYELHENHMVWMRRNKIGLGIIDTSLYAKNKLLLEVSKNCVDYWVEELVKADKEGEQKIEEYEPLIKIDKDANNLLSWASQKGLDFIIVGALGITFKAESEFFTELKNYFNENNNDIAITGHLLDKGENFYQLHHQTFIVNVKWWEKQGCPLIGEEQHGEKELPKVIRSEESHHDGYTPLWIKSDGSKTKYKNVHWGWNIIASALSSGYEIKSFNKSLRQSKYYFYPEVRNDAHTKINYITQHMDTNKHFIANTENVNCSIDKSFDCLITTAGGMSPLINSYFAKIKPYGKVIVVDTSPLALNCQEALTDKLQSNDIDIRNFKPELEKIMQQHSFGTSYTKIFSAVPKIDKMQNQINKLLEDKNFNEFLAKIFPTLKISYRHVDLLNDKGYVANKFKKFTEGFDTVIINVSNVYHYYPTCLLYSLKQRYDIYFRLLNQLEHQEPNKYFIWQSEISKSVKEAIDSYTNQTEEFGLLKVHKKVVKQWAN